jgi:hypothetical protein
MFITFCDIFLRSFVTTLGFVTCAHPGTVKIGRGSVKFKGNKGTGGYEG